jgi:AcrR family transcriptional regulator
MSDHKKCKTYHHGDLRNTLIIAAAELIEERGSVDFAMIEAARRAGVSSAAPYRHFRDREAANSGFYVLEESVRAWCETSAIGDEDTLGLAVKLWATAHGLACLAMNHTVYRFIVDADIYALLESSTRTFLDGLRRRVAE